MKKQTITIAQIKMLLIILFVGMTGAMGIDIYLPSLPALMSFLHANKVHMQYSVTLYLLGFGVSMLVYGPLSDRHGRKPVVMTSLLVFSAISFMTVFVHSITVFLVIRLIQGVSAGGCAGMGRTMTIDILNKEEHIPIRSYFSLIITISPLLAPVLGGYFQHNFGWHASFIFLGALLLMLFIIYGLFCPETNQHKCQQSHLLKTAVTNYILLLKHPLFIGATLLSGIAMAVNMAFSTMSSFIFQLDFHLSPIVYGWICAIVATGLVSGKIASSLYVRRLGSVHSLRFGIFLLIGGGLILWLLSVIGIRSVPIVVCVIFFTVVAQPFIVTSSMAYALAPFTERRGAAGAIYGCFQVVVAFASTSIASSLPHEGVAQLGASYCLLGLIACVLFFGLVKGSVHLFLQTT
ncbi:MAG: hypothetical protein COB66_07610 [Coxiella sp. (in: Bacteria)]|nr:MAG: hypothetical protein COB66_07610 [Coxiella sp. (in: g-proteobacteria)]